MSMTLSPSQSLITFTDAENHLLMELREPQMSCWQERLHLLPDTEMSAREALDLSEDSDVASSLQRLTPSTLSRPPARATKSPPWMTLYPDATSS